jgi:5-methyltetrahydropteroyltriglutamate--homocysteine methyltransferase
MTVSFLLMPGASVLERAWGHPLVSQKGGKILITGVASYPRELVEHPELVADAIIAFAELVGRENFIAGTDCG